MQPAELPSGDCSAVLARRGRYKRKHAPHRHFSAERPLAFPPSRFERLDPGRARARTSFARPASRLMPLKDLTNTPPRQQQPHAKQSHPANKVVWSTIRPKLMTPAAEMVRRIEPPLDGWPACQTAAATVGRRVVARLRRDLFARRSGDESGSHLEVAEL